MKSFLRDVANNLSFYLIGLEGIVMFKCLLTDYPNPFACCAWAASASILRHHHNAWIRSNAASVLNRPCLTAHQHDAEKWFNNKFGSSILAHLQKMS